jgi:hypothetical protein
MIATPQLNGGHRPNSVLIGIYGGTLRFARDKVQGLTGSMQW